MVMSGEHCVSKCVIRKTKHAYSLSEHCHACSHYIGDDGRANCLCIETYIKRLLNPSEKNYTKMYTKYT